MTILKDLLALRAGPHHTSGETPLTEARKDLDELIDKWSDANKAWSWEGERGVRHLTNLVRELDSNYSSLHEFFTDNPGALEAVREWIASQNNKEWVEALQDTYGDDGDDDDDDK